MQVDIAQPHALVTITRVCPGHNLPLVYNQTLAIELADPNQNDDLLDLIMEALRKSDLKVQFYGTK